MKREIIAYKGYFKEFFENLDAGTQDKILYVLKTEITPKKEIDKAKILRKEYYGSKNKCFNVSALIDERFGKEGTASRAEAEEKAYAFYTGQIIEDARKKAKITQAELARRIGSDRSYISRVESGQTEPKVSTFYRIMNALGCRIEFSMSL